MRNPIEGREWLYLLEDSHLLPQTRSLVSKMQEEVKQKDLSYFWQTFYLLLDIRKSFPDPLEQAEATVECALSIYQLGDLQKVVTLLKEAEQLYGENKHYKAVVLWMLGCVQWGIAEEPGRAYESWNLCLSLFTTLKNSSVDQEQARWYADRIQQIRKDFSDKTYWPQNTAAAASAAEEAAPAARSTPAANSPAQDLNDPAPVANVPGANEEVNPLLFQLFQVVEKIPAGGFGAVGFRPLSIGEVDIDRVIIQGGYYRMVNLRGASKRVTLPANKYVVVKITGDSMNKPGKLGEEGIDLGDFVLLRLQEIADDGDIIAAEIDNEDSAATLKRFRIAQAGAKYILEPQSTNLVHQPREFTALNEGFHIRGVALVAFKPIKQ